MWSIAFSWIAGHTLTYEGNLDHLMIRASTLADDSSCEDLCSVLQVMAVLLRHPLAALLQHLLEALQRLRQTRRHRLQLRQPLRQLLLLLRSLLLSLLLMSTWS